MNLIMIEVKAESMNTDLFRGDSWVGIGLGEKSTREMVMAWMR